MSRGFAAGLLAVCACLCNSVCGQYYSGQAAGLDYRNRNVCARPVYSVYLQSCRGEHAYGGAFPFPSATAYCDCARCSSTIRLICAANGRWDLYPGQQDFCWSPQCVPCRVDNTTTFADIRCGKSARVSRSGEAITCQCRHTCRDVTLTCAENGHWRYYPHICEAPVTVYIVSQNLYINFNNLTSTYFYTCARDYTLHDGGDRRCNDGTLEGTQPRCLPDTATTATTTTKVPFTSEKIAAATGAFPTLGVKSLVDLSTRSPSPSESTIPDQDTSASTSSPGAQATHSDTNSASTSASGATDWDAILYCVIGVLAALIVAMGAFICVKRRRASAQVRAQAPAPAQPLAHVAGESPGNHGDRVVQNDMYGTF